jgi:PhnB protein
MAKRKAPETAPLGLVLHVADIPAAAAFYRRLGFVETGSYPGADGRIVVSFLAHGTSVLLLGNRAELHYENAARAALYREGPVGLGAVITLRVPDLAAVYAAVQDAGARIMMEPADEFYGDRVFMFLDPDGYEWKISQTIAAVDADAIRKVVAASRAPRRPRRRSG